MNVFCTSTEACDKSFISADSILPMTISSKRHFLHLCVQLSLRLLCLRIAVRTPNLDGDSVLKSTDHGQSGFPNDQETPGFSWPSTWKILQLLAIHCHFGNPSWCSRMCRWPSRSSNTSRLPLLAKSCIPQIICSDPSLRLASFVKACKINVKNVW